MQGILSIPFPLFILGWGFIGKTPQKTLVQESGLFQFFGSAVPQKYVFFFGESDIEYRAGKFVRSVSVRPAQTDSSDDLPALLQA
jgi:hypothetical protein